ncbi:MAG: carboxymuconolactone decarboxylase family protein [Armatimonadetes bacterium]|nr:carboxymuconolactone decarboxylase family protein [Armatimonadota bacterium]
MAYIEYLPESEIPPEQRVADKDNIIRVHGVHPEVMRLHYDLYLRLMHKAGPLSRVQREMVAIVVSVENSCHY